MKVFAAAAAACGVTGFAAYQLQARPAHSHCQVPCGIYDDNGRIKQLREDTLTITKAITQINVLAQKTDAQSLNQSVRWITTKDQHASHVITTVGEYFLTQKVKVVDEGEAGYDDYVKALVIHHRVLKAAMKTKQTVDPKAAQELAHEIDHLGDVYGAH